MVTQSIGNGQEQDDGGPVADVPPSTDCTSRGPDVNLSLCDLIAANLRGADLTNADLSRIFWDYAICPDGTNSATNDLVRVQDT
ncbi:MAG: pentapeptide repeat-containing protein [Chloroflexia bacterium]|nr:pentapeptide repeat-containing protein [Chloroflexia bacterium]